MTNLPVQTLEDALEKIRWYALRWKIEMFHKVLKTGCRAEQAKLRTAERLSRLIAVFCILSWRVFWMTMVQRTILRLPRVRRSPRKNRRFWTSSSESLKTRRPAVRPTRSESLGSEVTWQGLQILRQAIQLCGGASPDSPISTSDFCWRKEMWVIERWRWRLPLLSNQTIVFGKD